MSDTSVRNTGIFETASEDRLRVARSRSTTHSRALDAARDEAKKAAYGEAFELGQSAGYAEGFETGRREAVVKFTAQLDDELAQVVAEVKECLDQIGVAVESFYQDAETQLAGIAREVVSRVLDSELATSEEAIIGMTRAAIAEVAQSREVVVRVNIASKPVLEANREALLRSFSGIKSFEVIADPTVGSGCIVESSHGSVDASKDTILRLIEGEAA